MEKLPHLDIIVPRILRATKSIASRVQLTDKGIDLRIEPVHIISMVLNNLEATQEDKYLIVFKLDTIFTGFLNVQIAFRFLNEDVIDIAEGAIRQFDEAVFRLYEESKQLASIASKEVRGQLYKVCLAKVIEKSLELALPKGFTCKESEEIVDSLQMYYHPDFRKTAPKAQA